MCSCFCICQKRVLLITDSIISGFPVNIFNNNHIVCIKKTPENKLLANIDIFEQEFSYTDYVIISAGTNDLSRFGKSGESLGSFMSARIREWCIKYPKTVFIFNSVLHTDIGPWLNHRVDVLNRTMFDLSVELYESNFWFLDTHAALVDVADRFPIISPGGNGIHISHKACQYLSRIVADAIEAYDMNSSTISRVWPLRIGFRRLISGSLHPRNKVQERFIGRRLPGPRYWKFCFCFVSFVTSS